MTATDHPTAAAILARILAEPGEDAHRLVYADWLEENGAVRMARFIRTAVEKGDDESQGEFHYAIEHTLPFDAAAAFGLPDGWDVTCYEKLHDLRSESPTARSALTRRGFVSRIACPLAAWLAHGPAVVRAHPVEAVTASDSAPECVGGTYWWYDTGPGERPDGANLPDEIFLRLPGAEKNVGEAFDTRRDALAALSAAAILWAKSAPVPAP